MLGWREVRYHTKDAWKSIITVSGELSATTVSAMSMLELLATVLAMGKTVLYKKLF